MRTLTICRYLGMYILPGACAALVSSAAGFETWGPRIGVLLAVCVPAWLAFAGGIGRGIEIAHGGHK